MALICQFCGEQGYLAAAPSLGPPPPRAGSQWPHPLKLVFCDYHLHNCVFYVCNPCFRAESHLCRNSGEHPNWAERAGPVNAKRQRGALATDAAREKYSLRYHAEFPAVCATAASRVPYCASCWRPNPPMNVFLTTCCNVWVLPRNRCPACFNLELIDGDRQMVSCPLKSGKAAPTASASSPPDAAAAGPLTDDELSAFDELYVHYADAAWYGPPPSPLPENFRQRFRIANAKNLNDDPAGWARYVSTNIRYGKGFEPISGVVVFLPEAALDDKSKKKLGGAVLYYVAEGRPVPLDGNGLAALRLPSTGWQPTRFDLTLPTRGARGGGNGGALGRANKTDGLGFEHILFIRAGSTPEVESKEFKELVGAPEQSKKRKKDARDGPRFTVVKDRNDLKGAFLIQTLSNSSIELWARAGASSRDLSKKKAKPDSDMSDDSRPDSGSKKAPVASSSTMIEDDEPAEWSPEMDASPRPMPGRPDLVFSEVSSEKPMAMEFEGAEALNDEREFWRGYPLQLRDSVEQTWQALAHDALERRTYKDTGLHVVAKPSTDRKERPQNALFEEISATLVATGLSNANAQGRYTPAPSDPRKRVLFEWSHLIGDGRGGGIHRGNVVASTRANNTEMLALEGIVDQYVETIAAAQAERDKKAKVKRGKDDRDIEVVMRVQVTTHPAIGALQQRTQLASGTLLSMFSSHIGQWMRFSVYLRGKKGMVKAHGTKGPVPELVPVIDHILDCNRARISPETVRVLQHQARFAFRRVLRRYFDIEISSDGFKPGEGALFSRWGRSDAKAVDGGVPVNEFHYGGDRFTKTLNAGGGDCLFYSVLDAVNNLAALTHYAGVQFNDHATLRAAAVRHLHCVRTNLAADGAFQGNMNVYSLPDPLGVSIDRAEFNLFAEQQRIYDFDLYGDAHYADWLAYEGMMLQPGIDGDTIMTAVLSHLLGLRIVMYEVENGQVRVSETYANARGGAPTIRILNQRIGGFRHFEALTLIPPVAVAVPMVLAGPQ